MRQLQKFLYGRYGFDKFSQLLILISLILSVLSSLSGSRILLYLAILPFFYALFRTLSKDTNKRVRENYKFDNYLNQAKKQLSKTKQYTVGTKTHKFYPCPKCNQTIRVPRGKGRISITCPKCHTEFIKRT